MSEYQSSRNEYRSNQVNYQSSQTYANAGYSDNNPRPEVNMVFLCRGTCGTEVGCSCGRNRR